MSVRSSQGRLPRLVALLALVALVGGLSQRAFAQVPAAAESQALSGVVQDTRGVPLLGAFVAAIALGSNQPAAIMVTDARGRFRFGNLPAGIYSLLVGSLGFTGTVLQGINVPGAAPVSLQLEAEGGRALATLDASLDLSWALRSGKRDVLRGTEATLVGDNGELVGDRRYRDAVRPANVASPVMGEFRLWSFTRASDRETIGVTTLSLGNEESWSLRAHVGDHGAVWASSDFRRELSSAHSLEVEFGYVGGNFEFLRPKTSEENDSWVGRLEVRDHWQVGRTLSVAYGAAYEHQNYLAQSSLLSPSIEVSYEPVANTTIVTGVSYQTEGVELTGDDSGFEVMSLLSSSNLRVADTGAIRPERALRYHLGVERQFGPAEVRVQAYFDEVTDELLGVYVADPDGASNYLLFNVGDASARGFELALAGSILEHVSGEFTYAFRERGADYSLASVASRVGTDLSDWEGAGTRTHELQASVDAEVSPLHTRVLAVYNWKRGMPVMRDGELRDEFGRFDLGLRQPLPFRALDTEWSAMLQIRNILGPEYESLYNVSLAELLGLTRGIAGGLAVRF